MASKDDAYGERNARDASFTVGETAVILWAVGASTRWERLFFELVQASDEVTRSELHLVFPYLIDAFTEFTDGDLRQRWADSHTELAASLRAQAGGGRDR
jgi:hypothetical protein